MNRQQAQEILILYRPGAADAGDAAFVEALELARNDSELARWLENHCANYAAVRTQLKQIAVPAGLKEQILTEQKSHAKIVSLPRSSWRRPVLAIAAVIILLLGIASIFFPFRTKTENSAYRNRMVSTALRLYAMDLVTNDLNQVRAFLAQKKAPSDYVLPQQLQKLECTGCVVLRWQDKPVSMICFRTGRPLPPGQQSDLFLFVADTTSFPKYSSEVSVSLKEVSRATTASWAQGDKFYLLVAEGGQDFIRKFL